MADPKQHTGIARNPRKKQTVTKTTKASTIKKITENAAQSRLLGLPAEVLQIIFLDLLGHKFVHIKNMKDSSLETAYNAESKGMVFVPLGPLAFRHAICVADQSSGQMTVLSGEADEYFVPSFRKRHEGCACCGRYPKANSKENRGTLRFDLRVLGACRQMYQEGSYHFLATPSTFYYIHDWYVQYADQAEKNFKTGHRTAAEKIAKYQRTVTRLADFRAKVGVAADEEDEAA